MSRKALRVRLWAEESEGGSYGRNVDRVYYLRFRSLVGAAEIPFTLSSLHDAAETVVLISTSL